MTEITISAVKTDELQLQGDMTANVIQGTVTICSGIVLPQTAKSNTILNAGEIAIDMRQHPPQIRIGNGVDTIDNLPYKKAYIIE